MTNEVARAYVISRLNDGQFHGLHHREKRNGCWWVPAQIHEYFNTEPWGDVPEDAQREVARVVNAITKTVEDQVRAKGVAFSLEHQHNIDIQVRGAKLEFVGAKKLGSTREKLARGRREYDPFENE